MSRSSSPPNSGGTSSSSMHENILRFTKGDVFKKYEVLHLLGTGSMGAVSTVRIRDDKVGGSAFDPRGTRGRIGQWLLFKNNRHFIKPKDRPAKSTEYLFALKMIQRDRVSPTFLQELRNELAILRSMDHPNIIKAHECYEYKDKQLYLVLELCDGGDLYTRTPYSQRQAHKIVSKLLSAVRYMHEHNVVHRDLKYENILFENKTETAEIKVIDFGLSKKFYAGQPNYMTERVGTIYTMAPQVIQGVYSAQADLWSVGVIAYMVSWETKKTTKSAWWPFPRFLFQYLIMFHRMIL
jgi:serine/threonine protein kinase